MNSKNNGPALFFQTVLSVVATDGKDRRCLKLENFGPFLTLSLPNVAKGKLQQKIPNFILQNLEKQVASCVSTGREVSFEWSLHRVSSKDSKVRVTLQNSIKHSGSERING